MSDGLQKNNAVPSQSSVDEPPTFDASKVTRSYSRQGQVASKQNASGLRNEDNLSDILIIKREMDDSMQLYPTEETYAYQQVKGPNTERNKLSPYAVGKNKLQYFAREFRADIRRCKINTSRIDLEPVVEYEQNNVEPGPELVSSQPAYDLAKKIEDQLLTMDYDNIQPEPSLAETRRCCVPRCSTKDPGLSYHGFPKDVAMRRKWEAALGVGETNQYAKVCSRHFLTSDYFPKNGIAQCKLYPHAVPSQHYIPATSHDKEQFAKRLQNFAREGCIKDRIDLELDVENEQNDVEVSSQPAYDMAKKLEDQLLPMDYDNIQPEPSLAETRRCCVPRCSTKDPGLSYHGFPKDVAMRRKWEAALGVGETNQYAKVCSRHFSTSDYFPKKRNEKGRRLYPHAVPSQHYIPATSQDKEQKFSKRLQHFGREGRADIKRCKKDRIDLELDVENEQNDVEDVFEPPCQAQGEYSCNICKECITGFRYTCVQCRDWDLCGACEARSEHHEHYVLRVPPHKTHSDTQTVLTALRQMMWPSAQPERPDIALVKQEVKTEHPPSPVEVLLDEPVEHPGHTHEMQGEYSIYTHCTEMVDNYLDLESTESTDIDNTSYILPTEPQNQEMAQRAKIPMGSTKKRKHITQSILTSSMVSSKSDIREDTSFKDISDTIPFYNSDEMKHLTETSHVQKKNRGNPQRKSEFVTSIDSTISNDSAMEDLNETSQIKKENRLNSHIKTEEVTSIYISSSNDSKIEGLTDTSLIEKENRLNPQIKTEVVTSIDNTSSNDSAMEDLTETSQVKKKNMGNSQIKTDEVKSIENTISNTVLPSSGSAMECPTSATASSGLKVVGIGCPRVVNKRQNKRR